MKKYPLVVVGIGLFLVAMVIIWIKSGILGQHPRQNYANFNETYLMTIGLTVTGIFFTFLDGIVGKRILVALSICTLEVIFGLLSFFIVNAWLSMLAG